MSESPSAENDAPATTGGAGDEMLATYFHGRFNASAVDETECFHMSNYRRCEAAASALLASDWLAADRRATAEFVVEQMNMLLDGDVTVTLNADGSVAMIGHARAEAEDTSVLPPGSGDAS